MINRRRSVQTLIATPLLLMAGTRQGWATSPGPFRHGVASGDPDHGSVVIWTRITPERPDSADVHWEVSDNPDFNNILSHGHATTSAERDFTVKVIATGLSAGARFFYRFRYAGFMSPIGRTRTLPTSSPKALGIALVSCSNYAFGYFNAYAAIAEDPNVDFVLHTGDYLYEYGAKEWGYETARRLQRLHEPTHEIVSLADYRTRHAQYRTDQGLQAMHGAHPFLACWDDHESANNPWLDGAENHQSDKEGSWAARREASIRAYYEWMPIRDPGNGVDPRAFWRVYRFGQLATLVTLETRHTGRSRQIDYAEYKSQIVDGASRDRFMTDVIGKPGRTMLSNQMEQDLKQAITDSVNNREPWRLIGNAIPMARMLVPDLRALGVLPDTLALPAAEELRWKGQWGLPFYTDTWDGYPWARERFYQLCRTAGARDLLVLTGDSHSFWLNQLSSDDGSRMGIELGTAGVTSPGDFVESGFDAATAARLDDAFSRQLDEVVWTDNLHQGYVRVNLQADVADAAYIAVRTLDHPDATTRTIRSVRIERLAGELKLSDSPDASAA